MPHRNNEFRNSKPELISILQTSADMQPGSEHNVHSTSDPRAGIKFDFPRSAPPCEMTSKSCWPEKRPMASRSARFLGLGFRLKTLNPSPSPDMPWQTAQ